jgi:hypothetical protein
MRELEPQAYGRMIADFTTALRSGKSEAEATGAASQVAVGLMQKYFPTASDEALLALRDQWIGLLSKYKDKNSRACISVFTDGKINLSRAFPDWDTTRMLRVLDMVLRSGGSTKIPIPVDKKAADDDVAIVFKPAAEKFGNDLLLLQKPDQWMANSQKVCDMLLMIYQQIAALPDKRGANVIRYLVTNSVTSSKSTPSPTAVADSASAPSPQPNASAYANSGSQSYPTPRPSLIPKAIPFQTVSSVRYRVVGIEEGDYLNVQQGPGSNYTTVAKLRRGTSGIIRGTGSRVNGAIVWQEISIGGIRGWVDADHLSFSTAP